MAFICFRYDFSVALISALALLPEMRQFKTKCSDLKTDCGSPKGVQLTDTRHVHRTEKFRYPINDVKLKRGKQFVKNSVSNGVWGKSSSKMVIKSTARSITKLLMRFMFI